MISTEKEIQTEQKNVRNGHTRNLDDEIVALPAVAQRAGAVRASCAREVVRLEREVGAVLVGRQVHVAAGTPVAAIGTACNLDE